jgi:hypothetical protein
MHDSMAEGPPPPEDSRGGRKVARTRLLVLLIGLCTLSVLAGMTALYLIGQVPVQPRNPRGADP